MNECGESIPYSKFGYKSLQEFLYSINDLIVQKNHAGELVIRVRASEKSAHIANLVKEQRSPSKKKKKRPKSAPGRTANYNFRPSLKRSTGSHFKSTTKLNIESPEKKYSSKPSPPPKKNSKPPFNYRVPLCTTNANIDVRGIPFVVVSDKNNEDKDQSDKENNREGYEVKPRRESTSEDEIEIPKIETLKITVNRSRRHVEVEKNSPLNPRVRFSVSTLEHDCDDCKCPEVNGYTLFGDDFFFEYAVKYLNSGAVGMCQSNMSVIEASKVFHWRHSWPEKIIILLGAVDIILGRDFEDIAYDFYNLINDVTTHVEKVVVCTIPPLLNINKNQLKNLLRVNTLIECIPEDMDREVKIIDLYEEFNTLPKLKLNISELYDVRKELPITFNEKGYKILSQIFDKRLKK